MQAMANSLDFIIDTASGDHSLDHYMSCLKTAGVLALVGFPGDQIKLSPASLLRGKLYIHQINFFFRRHIVKLEY